ncbi:MAG: hypothetical protein WDZ80_05305 [Candidatus Paceibacterota bacterium]
MKIKIIKAILWVIVIALVIWIWAVISETVNNFESSNDYRHFPEPSLNCLWKK